jgi:hypothetical protein
VSEPSEELIGLLDHARKMLSIHGMLPARENNAVRQRIQRLRDGDGSRGPVVRREVMPDARRSTS